MIEARDLPVAPGRFRHVRTDTVLPGQTERGTYRRHDTEEVWIPHDPEGEWVRRVDQGRVEWLTDADPDAPSLPRRLRREDRARYGTFDHHELDPPPEPGWYHLTPGFLAGLPRDPAALFALVEREYASGTAEPNKAYFQHVTRLLVGPALPADLRTACYRALTHIDGVAFTDEGSRTIVGFSGRAAGREELVIDRTDGVVVGRRWLGPDGSPDGAAVLTHRIVDRVPAWVRE